MPRGVSGFGGGHLIWNFAGCAAGAARRHHRGVRAAPSRVHAFRRSGNCRGAAQGIPLVQPIVQQYNPTALCEPSKPRRTLHSETIELGYYFADVRGSSLPTSFCSRLLVCLMRVTLLMVFCSGFAGAQTPDSLAARIDRVLSRPEFRRANFGVAFYSL